MLASDVRVALQQLEDDTIRLGHRAESLIPVATAALLSGDGSTATRVVSIDDQIDVQAEEALALVHRMLLLQSPVADDLRRLMALLTVIRSVERIGDHCVNIVRLASPAEQAARHSELVEQLQEMALRAERTVARGLDCYARRAADGSVQLAELDDGIDLLRQGLMTRLTHHAEHGAPQTRWAIPMIRAATHYERIGDHAVRIAEQGRWVATGQRD